MSSRQLHPGDDRPDGTCHSLVGSEQIDPAMSHTDAVPEHLLPLVEGVEGAAGMGRHTLEVSTGRASAFTQLKEAQIRYVEDLGALQPAKPTAQTGSSRLYTMTDLRRLYAL